MDADRILWGHTDEATAFVVDDYPYGFRLRTQIRYWIETTKNGDRFCSQTLNPKTDKWNKPKKGTYMSVMFLYLDSVDHVHAGGVRTHSTPEVVAEFVAFANEGRLSVAQKAQLARVIGIAKAMEGVTFSIREGPATPENDAEQAKIATFINRRAEIQTRQAFGDLS